MFYDFANLLLIFILILIPFRLGLIPGWLSFFLAVFACTPFFLNDVLFPASLFSDQFRYLDSVQNIRSLDFTFYDSASIEISSRMLALIPLPYSETMQSLGFFNRLLATALIIWLYVSKKIRGWPLLFILFYPSFLLYSSVGLRDTLVLLFMTISVILFLEKRRLAALFFSLPLLYIKFQNFFIFIMFFVIHLSFSKGTLIYKFRYLILPIILAAITPYIMTIIELLDVYRRYFFIDDGGDPNLYVSIETFKEFIILAFQSAPYFLIKPLPWEAANFIQFVQSLENLFLFGFLVFIFIKVSKFDKEIAFKWLVFLILAFSIYGLTVFNFGTAVRYKFPFIVVVIIGIAYELYLKHGQFILNRRTIYKKSPHDMGIRQEFD